MSAARRPSMHAEIQLGKGNRTQDSTQVVHPSLKHVVVGSRTRGTGYTAVRSVGLVRRFRAESYGWMGKWL
ncbi:hypothetical protein EXIGLDRAFT_717859, partial [Exidia glandulosa HHB12029]